MSDLWFAWWGILVKQICAILHNGAYWKTHLHKLKKMSHVFPCLLQIGLMCHLCTKKHNLQIAYRCHVAVITPLAWPAGIFFYNVDPIHSDKIYNLSMWLIRWECIRWFCDLCKYNLCICDPWLTRTLIDRDLCKIHIICVNLPIFSSQNRICGPKLYIWANATCVNVFFGLLHICVNFTKKMCIYAHVICFWV